MDEDLVLRLKKFGMNEYEAKVYSALFGLRVASAREIHEFTQIPRGRVYETLNALMEKHFVVSAGGSPARYHVCDVSRTFEQIKKDTMDSLNDLSEYLTGLERDRPERLLQAYELRSQWAIDSQVQLMFRRVKSEMLIICDDAEFLKRYASDLKKLDKRVALYVIVRTPELAEHLGIRCYLGGRDIECGMFCPPVPDGRSLLRKIAIYADRQDSLSVVEENGMLEGVFLSNDLFSGYLYHCILNEIQPVRSGTL